MFKQHLEMIGRNESPSKKAKFWQSYVRSLKGSDDIRAHDSPRVKSWRPLSADLPPLRSIYDEPQTASERIVGSGYRYLPVHRETYGYSPRPIYAHHYNRPTGEYNQDAERFDAERAWHEHQRRMKEIERRYPSRYGLYLKDKPNTVVVPLEYEPDNKPSGYWSRAPSRAASRAASRAPSVPPPDFAPSFPRGFSVPLDMRAGTPFPDRALSPLDLLRLPIYRASRLRDSILENILNPRASMPISSITRDPFWYDLDDLRPFGSRFPFNDLPEYLRESYLSPIKRRFLWSRHPLRSLASNSSYYRYRASSLG